MTKEAKRQTINLVVSVVLIIITAVVTRSAGKVDQIGVNKQKNVQQDVRIDRNEQDIQGLVTKEYFDLAIEDLKEYIKK